MNRNDIYLLGHHKLMCGDSTMFEDVQRLTSGKEIDMIFTDPPYAVFGSSTGMKKDVADINMVKPFFRSIGDITSRIVKGMAHVYIFCDWRTYCVIREEIGKFLQIKNNIVWTKPPAGYQGSSYSNNYENIILFTRSIETMSMYDSYRHKDQPKHRAIYDSNVWYDKPVPIKEREHFAAKPISIITRAINNSTDEGEIVLDLFAGSGSTLITCENTNRRCYNMEIDPHCCDIIIKRWEKITGKRALKLDESTN